MVVKPVGNKEEVCVKFESRVILDGSQTLMLIRRCPILFESRVILDGSQTRGWRASFDWLFESRVILDGSQTE